jgi:hypothetical protein
MTSIRKIQRALGGVRPLYDRPAAQTLGTILTRASCTALRRCLLLRILVWDGADDVVAPTVLRFCSGVASGALIN